MFRHGGGSVNIETLESRGMEPLCVGLEMATGPTSARNWGLVCPPFLTRIA
jgi:hypothetical protein